MRHLVLVAFTALMAVPLSAHDHWRGPHRVVVVEAPRYAPLRHWEERRFDDRWERQYWRHRHDCDDALVTLRPLPRPLAPPFEGRMELQFH